MEFVLKHSVIFYTIYANDLLQFFKGLNITADQKKFFRKALHAYYEAVAELLQSEHTVRILRTILLLSFSSILCHVSPPYGAIFFFWLLLLFVCAHAPHY